MRKRIYIAGAITPTDKTNNPIIEYTNNVKKFLDAAIELMLFGYAPYTPALDLLILIRNDYASLLTEEILYQTSLSFLDSCEAIFLLPGWENSKGTKKELKYAEKKGIPVFTSIEELLKGVPNEK